MDSLKTMAALAVALGCAVAALNMRFVLRGNGRAIKFYLIAKSVVALYFAVLYALVFVEIIPPGTTSPWLRPSAVLLLFLLVLDALLRRDNRNDD